MSKLFDFLKGLNKGQLTGFIAGVAVIAAAIVVMAVRYSGVEYVAVYNGHGDGDGEVQAVVQRLKARGVLYRVEGGVVSVPDTERDAATRDIESTGITRAPSAGFEIFDRPGFFVPEFTQRINYSRALSGELARSIGEIEGVVEARVHLVLPDRGIFGAREPGTKAASAAVIIRLKPGVVFTRAQADSVAQIVAAGAPELKPGNVTVVDTAGRLLAGGSGALALGGIDRMRKDGGTQDRLKAADMPVAGAGRANTRVEAAPLTPPVKAVPNRPDVHYGPYTGYVIAALVLVIAAAIIIIRLLITRRKAAMREVEAALERLISQKAPVAGLEGRELTELRALVRKDPRSAALVLKEWVSQG
ncbi:MAG: hypothetical protein HZB85_06470 [Deltaproteobacteria bacterium]|nr:hypothetical protein [Deltaproteobacteria bacterium]